MHGDAHAFRQRRVVRRALAEGIGRVRPADQPRFKRLRGLHGAEPVARRGIDHHAAVIHALHRILERDRGHAAAELFARFPASAR